MKSLKQILIKNRKLSNNDYKSCWYDTNEITFITINSIINRQILISITKILDINSTVTNDYFITYNNRNKIHIIIDGLFKELKIKYNFF
jgi:hypothetical protein